MRDHTIRTLSLKKVFFVFTPVLILLFTLLVSPSNAQSSDTFTNIISYWKLDDSGTTITDSAGSNNSISNANTSPVPGKIANARSFNGTNSNIRFGNAVNYSGSNFSIGAWVNVNAHKQINDIIHKDFQYSIAISSAGKVSYADSSNWCYDCFGWYGYVPTNSWTHIVAVRNGTNVKIYINGVQVVSKTFGGAISQTSNQLMIGCYANGAGTCQSAYHFNGKIDEVGLWSKSLTASEVTPLYNGGAGLTYPNPSPSPSPTPTPSPPPPPPASGDSFEFAAAGDLNPSGNTSTSSHSGRNAASIIAGLNDGSLDNFILTGDVQYDQGTCSALGAYNQLWGAAKAKTLWTAGPHHDVEPGRNDDVDRYMDGQCVSTTKSATSTDLGRFQDALEWYAVDKGNWHILFAPTATWLYNASRAQAMTAEMDANLKAAKAAGKHLAVVYHDPYFTGTTSSHTRFTQAKPWIDMFWANRVRVLLSGSQHNYERTCPVNNADQCVADGMQQFQVSTGGIGLRTFTSSPSFVQRYFTDTWGHLRMSLKADGSYTWEFRPVSGGMQTDSGSRAGTGAPAPAPTPPAGGTSVFEKAVNIYGSQLIIDGKTFLSHTEAGVTHNGLTWTSPPVTFSPPVDASTSAMLRDIIWSNTGRFDANIPISNGSYQVYVYTWEDNNSMAYNLLLEGVTVISNGQTGQANTWQKLGPFPANVTDGQLTVTATGGHFGFSGIEIYK